MEMYRLNHPSRRYQDVYIRQQVYMNIEVGIQKLQILPIAVLHGDLDLQK